MSDPGRDNPRDLAAAYVLGALDEGEARAFEALLAGSAEARAEVAEYREVAALLSLGAQGAGLPAGLRARVLASAPSPEPRAVRIPAVPARASRVRAIPWLAAAAAVVLAVLLWNDRRALRSELVARDAAVAARDSLLADRDRLLAERGAALEAILEPGVEVIQLTSAGEAAPGMRVFLNRARRIATVRAFRLPPAASGRAYQLWFIREGAAVPSIAFNSEPGGEALILRVAVPDGPVTAVAVTEEPAGGSSQPTTTPFLVGTIGGT